MSIKKIKITPSCSGNMNSSMQIWTPVFSRPPDNGRWLRPEIKTIGWKINTISSVSSIDRSAIRNCFHTLVICKINRYKKLVLSFFIFLYFPCIFFFFCWYWCSDYTFYLRSWNIWNVIINLFEYHSVCSNRYRLNQIHLEMLNLLARYG